MLCKDDLLLDLSRSIRLGFEPDTGRFLFFSSAFRSETVKNMNNKGEVLSFHNKKKIKREVLVKSEVFVLVEITLLVLISTRCILLR